MEVQFSHALFHFLHQFGRKATAFAMPHLGREFSPVGGTQDCSSSNKQASQPSIIQWNRLPWFQDALVTTYDSNGFPTTTRCSLGNRTNDGVQPRTIASTCHYTDSFRHCLHRFQRPH